MAPFSFPKSFQILPRIDSKMHRIFDRFWHRFFLDLGSIWEANLEPSWPHFRPKWGSAVARRPLFCWVYVIFRFFGANPLGYPIGPCPKTDGVPLLGSVFGPMWARFSKVLWSILQVLRLFFWLPFWRCLAALFQTFPAGIRWAGGVTRSAKNLTRLRPVKSSFDRLRVCQILI